MQSVLHVPSHAALAGRAGPHRCVISVQLGYMHAGAVGQAGYVHGCMRIGAVCVYVCTLGVCMHVHMVDAFILEG